MPGTVTAVLSLLTIVLVFAGAAPDKVIVHVAVPGPLKLVGEQLSPLNWRVAVRFIVNDWVFPLTLAVMVALWFCVTTPELTENVALACPVAIVTLPGTARRTLLLPRDTLTGLAATLLNAPVHVDVALLPIVPSEQDRDCN